MTGVRCVGSEGTHYISGENNTRLRQLLLNGSDLCLGLGLGDRGVA